MKHKLPFFIWLIGITVASLLPSESLPNQTVLFPGADKAIHLCMYAGLAIFARMAFSRGTTTHTARLLVGLIAYGLLLEILQPLLSARTFEWFDILANTLGLIVGTLVYKTFLRGPEIHDNLANTR